METVSNLLNRPNRLFELSNGTVHKAAEKSAVKNMQILKRIGSSNGFSASDYEINIPKFREFLNTLNPAQKERYVKLAKSGKLIPMLIRQAHVLGTVANSDLEWFRDNTDISLSPEFFEADGGGWGEYKNTDRKPTKDEHDFYRFFSSMGTDTEGMSAENVERYRNAWKNFYIATMGVDPTAI